MESSNSFHAAPFLHQVGGHHACVSIPQTNMIAKPFDDLHERNFYEHLLHENLKGFVPQYFGVRDIEYVIGESGTESDDSHETSLHLDASQDGSSAGDLGVGLTANPWSMHCLNKEVAKLRQRGMHTKSCLLLEDLTARFRFPCILDIKMGTRAHPDDMSASKAERSQAKCLATTSSAVGLRLCGMQRFDHHLSRYDYVDKYRGRELRKEDILGSILDFVSVEWAASILKRWIEVLRNLEAVLRTYDGYRFYSSSLLLLYEGDPALRTEHVADAKLIDFAHTRHLPDPGPDEGLLFGVENLLSYLQRALDQVTPSSL